MNPVQLLQTINFSISYEHLLSLLGRYISAFLTHLTVIIVLCTDYYRLWLVVAPD